MTPQNLERARRIVSAFLDTEQFQNWSAERSNDFINHAERAGRCYDAAENGADGSTHQERIEDMRDYWNEIRKYGLDRVDAAVSAYLDSLESWHETNGTLFEDIG